MGSLPRSSMGPRVCVLNLGMGNLGSVCNALQYVGMDAVVSSDKETAEFADAYVLPGVGAFHEAMKSLERLGIIGCLERQILKNRKPFLGICLGLQLLAEDSLENGFGKGLGWIDGHVLPLRGDNHNRVPQVGWNGIDHNDGLLFDRIEQQGSFYFDHSFHLECEDELISAVCEHGQTVVAAIERENIFATQFHPEKSQRNGLKLLRNFAKFCVGNE